MKRPETGTCAKCGKKLEDRPGQEGNLLPYTKCIRCGLKYCRECWQPEFLEICPKCGGSCS